MLRKILRLGLVILLFLLAVNTDGQVRAVTEYGDSIYVYDDGTWSFEFIEIQEQEEDLRYLDEVLDIDTLSTHFVFSASADKEVENKNGQFKLKYNSSYWNRKPPGKINSEASFAFESKNEDIWGIVIDEESTFDKDVLYKIAKKMMEANTGAVTKIIKTELRNVNGAEVLRGVTSANISGLKFIFDSYYFSNELGSIQFVVWTNEALWSKKEKEIESFLNGLIIN